MIPDGNDGLGAKGAAVAFFIERQLAGPFGSADTWYMQGPWEKGTEEQGYQLKLTPAQFYRVAMRNIDDYCRGNYSNKTFAALAPADASVRKDSELLRFAAKMDLILVDGLETFFNSRSSKTR